MPEVNLTKKSAIVPARKGKVEVVNKPSLQQKTRVSIVKNTNKINENDNKWNSPLNRSEIKGSTAIKKPTLQFKNKPETAKVSSVLKTNLNGPVTKPIERQSLRNFKTTANNITSNSASAAVALKNKGISKPVIVDNKTKQIDKTNTASRKVEKVGIKTTNKGLEKSLTTISKHDNKNSVNEKLKPHKESKSEIKHQINSYKQTEPLKLGPRRQLENSKSQKDTKSETKQQIESSNQQKITKSKTKPQLDYSKQQKEKNTEAKRLVEHLKKQREIKRESKHQIPNLTSENFATEFKKTIRSRTRQPIKKNLAKRPTRTKYQGKTEKGLTKKKSNAAIKNLLKHIENQKNPDSSFNYSGIKMKVGAEHRLRAGADVSDYRLHDTSTQSFKKSQLAKVKSSSKTLLKNNLKKRYRKTKVIKSNVTTETEASTVDLVEPKEENKSPKSKPEKTIPKPPLSNINYIKDLNDRLMQNMPEPSVPRPDLLKFVSAMKEQIKVEDVKPDNKSFKSAIQNTLNAVFSTRDKFVKKPLLNNMYSDEAPFMVTPAFQAPVNKVPEDEYATNSKLSKAAQQFQRHARTLETIKPLERAVKECQSVEAKLLEKRKTQAQSEKAIFNKKGNEFSQTQLNANIKSNSSSLNSLSVIRESMDTKSSVAIFPNDKFADTFDHKVVKMAQRYSHQLEDARSELSKRLNAL